MFKRLQVSKPKDKGAGMKNIAVVIFLLVFLACASFVQGKEVMDESLDRLEDMSEFYADEETDKVETLIKYDFELGLEYISFHYREPSIMDEDGNLYGFSAAVTGSSRASSLVGRFEGTFAAGRVDYDGALSDGTPWTDKGDDYTIELRGLVGYNFKRNQTVLMPFFGLGFRYWNDLLESQYAYERETRYTYSPIGIRTNTVLSAGWSWGLAAEYDLFWSGVVKSHLSDVNVNYNNVRNKQDEGYGARCSFYVKRAVSESFSLLIEPFFRYWDIGQSDNADLTFSGTYIGYGYEPKNNTKEYGLKMSLVW
jgi:hypothetical protein